MDISMMSEEEQIQAAMQLSLQAPPAGAAGAPAAVAAAPAAAAAAPAAGPGAAQGAASVVAPERGKARAFPGKDTRDAPPLCPPRGSANKQRGAAPDGVAQEAGCPIELSSADAKELLQLVFGNRPEAADVERWFKVGFQFSPLPGTELGLWQRHGGPCGVFAPVQGLMVKQLFFGGAVGGEASEEAVRSLAAQPLAASAAGPEGEDVRGPLLAHALASVLFCAARESNYVVCQVSPCVSSAAERPAAAAASAAVASSPATASAAVAAATAIAAGEVGAAVTGRRVSRASEAQQLLEEGVETWLASPCGVLSFVCSVLLSRGLAAIRDDMDDPGTQLIGRFGHCSQELVNLMLIGEATSNVFDGTRWLGDDPTSGFLVKGVDGDRIGVPPLGFLSELEPMRYLCVGTLYKHPEFPIWVLGSPTHYTLVFSARRADSQLSQEAQLEQRAKKVFIDNAIDEGGLALCATLPRMLEALGVRADSRSQAQSELVREDVVLWEDFRAWVCKHFGVAEATTSRREDACRKLQLFLYDGQDPPGPSLLAVALEHSDIDPRLASGGSEGDALAATLQTRWPNAVVQVSPLAGHGAQPTTPGP